ncbi:MAG TPA: transposase [Methylomirabilota bacterium]|nr:transposase [Methylomirabilota bacterium]
MSRPLRLQLPGGTYHVTARGNARRPIFEDDDDRVRFLVVLASTVARYRMLCHAYCLMGNHYHLLVQTLEPNLSIAMRQLNGVYTQRFNRRHERCGHVLQGRFGAQLVDGDAYLREVCRYIVLNPVRAGLVAHPGDWRWSSFQATAGKTAVPGFLSVDWVRSLSGARTPTEAIGRFVSFVEAGIGAPESLVEQFSSKPVMSDGASTEQLVAQYRGAVPCTEFPRAQRFGSRPPLARTFENVASRADRNGRAVVAVRDHGYTMREVADFLGLHYITVSRALAQADGVPATEEMSECKT